MLLIRSAQRAVLSAPHRQPFLDAAFSALSCLFASDARLADRAAIDTLTHEALGDATAFGIHGVRELLLYVFLVFEHGRRVGHDEAHAWIGALLRDPALPPEAKLPVIYARLALDIAAPA